MATKASEMMILLHNDPRIKVEGWERVWASEDPGQLLLCSWHSDGRRGWFRTGQGQDVGLLLVLRGPVHMRTDPPVGA